MARRSSAEIAADLEAQEAAERAKAKGGSLSKADYQEGRDACTAMGIDPDAVSDAIRQLAKKFKRGPLELLWSVADNDEASSTARAAAAQAILPYLHGKPGQMKAAPPGKATGVMVVPMAQSMEEWMGIAASSQAALKESVRD